MINGFYDMKILEKGAHLLQRCFFQTHGRSDQTHCLDSLVSP